MSASIFATIGLLLGLTILFAILIAGDAILWSIGPYRRFKEVTYALETAEVAKVQDIKFTAPFTVRNLGHRRLSEVFDVPSGNDIQIVTCFGAIFLKEEAIEESLSHLKLSCGIALATMFVGGLVLIVVDPAKLAELAHVGPWELMPHMFEIILSSHLFLVTEMLVAAFLVLSLLTSIKCPSVNILILVNRL